MIISCMRCSFAVRVHLRHRGAGEGQQYQTFANRDPARPPVTGFSTGHAILGGAPARPVINRQEVTHQRAPIGQ
jgi:hypothetical protein